MKPYQAASGTDRVPLIYSEKFCNVTFFVVVHYSWQWAYRSRSRIISMYLIVAATGAVFIYADYGVDEI